ncbi:MAG: Gfo/Idh/MocA family oxidoreductase, partial [Bacteroidales bacterium]|nr:Gfo/Idh/MocA family oxidoreductase [Bacteroidales bacterium]
MSDISRREFLKKSGMAAAALAVLPDALLDAAGKPVPAAGALKAPKAATDKLNILGVGIGGRGSSDLREMETENIIGLCDVDWKYAGHVFDRYPKAKRFNDYRKMFDKMLDKADAVMVATADHTHAIIAADAIAAGKHVYVEKPLTLYAYESRLLTKLAKKYGVATQMGNQGASSAGTRKALNWLWNGEIGEVRKIEAFTDRPIWPQGIPTPSEKMPIPKTMNWDAFIGPARYRDYNAAYTPWNFRGWWDFGSGALG